MPVSNVTAPACPNVRLVQDLWWVTNAAGHVCFAEGRFPQANKARSVAERAVGAVPGAVSVTRLPAFFGVEVAALLPKRAETEDPVPAEGRDGIFDLVALASYTANTPVALRPPAARIDERQQSGRRRVTARDRARIVELYERGRSARYVASDVGVSKATVLTTLKRAGVEMRPVGARY